MYGALRRRDAHEESDDLELVGGEASEDSVQGVSEQDDEGNAQGEKLHEETVENIVQLQPRSNRTREMSHAQEIGDGDALATEGLLGDI